MRDNGEPPANWYEVIDAGNGVTIIREVMRVEDIKSFLVEGARDVAVLDTGMGVGDFAKLVSELSDKRPIVLQSHAHWDHIGASYRFDRVLVHPSEAEELRSGLSNEEFCPMFGPGKIELDRLPAGFNPETAFIPGTEPSGWISSDDHVDLGGRTLEAYHTPGHTPGGITLLDRQSRTLFPGDAINLDWIYLFTPTSDPAAWYRTIQLLADLADEVDVIRPSHGPALTPADVHEAAEAYQSVWTGRKPDERRHLDVGLSRPVDVAVFDFGRFTFLLAADRLSSRGIRG
jgi:glyoxylase-like metal-dependent hydrolase (beta-lactamase superfamily II)